MRLDNDREIEVTPAFAGAEGRYEDYVFLKMLQREWERRLTEDDFFIEVPEEERPSPRASIVVMFWTYFETRVERLLRDAMRALPRPVMDELLSRHSSISARLERLYAVLFETTYWDDLRDLGFPAVATLLKKVRNDRNRFMHGHPGAIDDKLVTQIVASLQEEHESWIAVYNRRATKIDVKAPPQASL